MHRKIKNILLHCKQFSIYVFPKKIYPSLTADINKISKTELSCSAQNYDILFRSILHDQLSACETTHFQKEL